MPKEYREGDALFDAMARWANHFGCPLVGGDIASSTGPLVLSVSIVGKPHAGRGPVLRSGAAVGDGVYVTGALGGSFDAATGMGKHLSFEPRVKEAKFLCDSLGARLHSMMDVSDGLGRDAGRLEKASGVGIAMEEALLPMATETWQRAVGDGEDYELLFAAAGEVASECPKTGTAITRIGTVVPGPEPAIMVLRDGGRVDVSGMGWEHGA